MATYPTYKRQLITNANIAAPSNIDFAATREAIRGANQTKEAANRVTNFALRKYDESMKFSGAQAGAEAPQETLKSMRGSTPVTTFDQAAYAAAVQVGSIQIEAEARETISKIYLDAKKNKVAPDVLQSQLDAAISGYGDALGNLDSRASQQLQAKLEGVARGVYLDRSGDYLNEEQKKLDAKAVGITEDINDQVSRLGRGDQKDKASQLKNIKTDYANNMGVLGVDPVKIQKTLEKFDNNYHKARVFGDIDRAEASGKLRDYFKKFKADAAKGKGLTKGLSQGQIEAFGSQIETKFREQGVLYRRHVAAVKKEITGTRKIIKSGGFVSPKHFNLIEDEAAKLKDPKLMASIETLKIQFEQANIAEAGGIPNLDTVISRLESQIVKMGKEGKTTPQSVLDYRDMLIGRRSALDKRLNVDPIAVHYEENGQPVPDIDLNDVSGLQDQFRIATDVGLKHGRTVQYFSKEQAGNIKDALSPLNRDLQGKRLVLSNIVNAAGPKSKEVLSEIGTKFDLREMVNVAALDNSKLLLDYMKGDEAQRAGNKIQEVATGTIDRVFKQKFGGAFTGAQIADRQAMLDAAKKIYIQRHGIDRFDSDEFSAIVQELFGGNGKYGGVLEYKGAHLILPFGVEREKDALEDIIENLTEKDLNLAGLDDVYGLGDANEDDERLAYPARIDADGEMQPYPLEQLKKLKLVSHGVGQYFLEDSDGERVISSNSLPGSAQLFVLDLR
jgi:hypothetical protein